TSGRRSCSGGSSPPASARSRSYRCVSPQAGGSRCRRQDWRRSPAPRASRWCRRRSRVIRRRRGSPSIALRRRPLAPPDIRAAVVRAARQEQFLEVVDRDEAEARFRHHLTLAPLGEEKVPLGAALGRVLARDVAAPVDVPGFDRAGVDGFALRAADTAGAADAASVSLRLNPEMLTPGVEPRLPVEP